MKDIQKRNEEYNELMEEINSLQDSNADKVKKIHELLKKSARDFKLMELEEQALILNPQLKNTLQ